MLCICKCKFFRSHYYSVTRHPGSILCVYAMCVAPHITCVYMMSVKIKLKLKQLSTKLYFHIYVCTITPEIIFVCQTV